MYATAHCRESEHRSGLLCVGVCCILVDGAPTLAGSIQGVQVVPCQTSSSNKFDSFLEVHARFDHTECDVIVGSSVMRE